jgi:hypothetical protein
VAENCDPKRKLVVYIAGPYRDWTDETKTQFSLWGVHRNVMRAREEAARWWATGNWAPICPHLNSMFIDGYEGCGDEVFLEGDLELLRRSDAICMLPGWENSAGARREREFALDMGLVLFENNKPWLANPLICPPRDIPMKHDEAIFQMEDVGRKKHCGIVSYELDSKHLNSTLNIVARQKGFGNFDEMVEKIKAVPNV